MDRLLRGDYASKKKNRLDFPEGNLKRNKEEI